MGIVMDYDYGFFAYNIGKSSVLVAKLRLVLLKFGFFSLNKVISSTRSEFLFDFPLYFFYVFVTDLLWRMVVR